MTDSNIGEEQKLCRDYMGWIRVGHLLPFINKISTTFRYITFINNKDSEYYGHFVDTISNKKIKVVVFCDMVGDELYDILYTSPWLEFKDCMKFMGEFVEHKEKTE